MAEVEFKLSPEEAAIICAELSLSLEDGRCSDPEEREKLVSIINKLAEPFGFDTNQIRSMTRLICGINLA